MNGFYQLFLANLKILSRNMSGMFWTIFLPAFIYVALCILPIGKNIHTGFSYSDYALPGVLAMTIMQTGIYTLAYWMIDLRSRGVIKRFLVTPLTNGQLILSVICSRLVITIVQIVVLTLIGAFLFNAKFAGNIFSVLILAMLGSSIFLIMGLLISNFAKTYETAAPITSAIGLPFTFLGNIFYPIEDLPSALQIVAKFLPITYLSDGFRQAYLYPFDFYKIGFDILVLSIWLVLMLLIMLKFFKLKEG
jgi:ABC-2 type transport system permease protein